MYIKTEDVYKHNGGIQIQWRLINADDVYTCKYARYMQVRQMYACMGPCILYISHQYLAK